MGQISYIAVQSFIDSSFFTRLSELKLNEYKLDSKPQRIYGKITEPKKLTKFNNVPVLSLDYNSFSKTDSHNISGYIHNVNTIEEFKSVNKKEALHSWGIELLKEFKSGNYDTQFHILSFCDLKKYKFYYWVAYPSLHSAWEVVEQDDAPQFRFDIEKQFYKEDDKYVYIDNCLTDKLSLQLKNFLFLTGLQHQEITLYVYKAKAPQKYVLKLTETIDEANITVTGWERTSQGKLGPKLANLSSLINPKELANQAVDLNLKLMKWRIAPSLDLDVIKSQKVLLLGAGTLGSYVGRALLGWGVRDITFVDNGRVSYSNPVRQPLFKFEDCFSDENGQGVKKAIRAADSLKEVFPGVNATGVELEVPMIGHEASKEKYDVLEELITNNDVVFLLMDSRESRWLPTVLGLAKDKLVINAALGFDSYLVLRHGTQEQDLGCYFCNDVVAPNDSLTDRTLDQMCTVTRPGAALMASSLAVELMVSLLESKSGKNSRTDDKGVLGSTPHQIRGFLHNFEQVKLSTPRYKYCSACSQVVVDNVIEHGWEFVERCLQSSDYLEEVCGLRKVKQDVEGLDDMFDDFELEDGEIQ